MTEQNIGHLMLSRREGESIEIFTQDEHIKVTVVSIFPQRVKFRMGDGRMVTLEPGSEFLTLGLGMTLGLKMVIANNAKLAFKGPKSVTVLRSELRRRGRS